MSLALTSIYFCHQPPPLGYSNSLSPPMRPSGSSQAWVTQLFRRHTAPRFFTGSGIALCLNLLTQRPNHTIAATTPHPLNASALAQSAAMPVSHGTFQPCAGMSVASVSSFISRSQPNKLFGLPLSYSAQASPLWRSYPSVVPHCGSIHLARTVGN